MSKAQEALTLANQILQMREKLRDLEHRFALLMGEPGFARNDASWTLPDDSIAGRIRALLRGEPRRKFSLMEIHLNVPGSDLRTVRTTTSRLARDEKGVVNVGRGRYQYLDPDGGFVAEGLDGTKRLVQPHELDEALGRAQEGTTNTD